MLIFEGPKSRIGSLAFAPDGRLFATTQQGDLLTWDGPGPPRILPPPHPGQPASINTIICDGETPGLYYSQGDGLWLHSFSTERPSQPLYTNFGSDITALAFLNSTTLVVGTGHRSQIRPGRLCVLDLQPERWGQLRKPEFLDPNGIRAVAADPVSRTIAWCNHNKRLHLWDITKAAPRVNTISHASSCLALQPGGEILVAAVDWNILVFDVVQNREKQTFRAHTGRVTSLVYSRDGRTLVSGSWDKTVRVWDANSLQLKATFDWGIGAIHSLACSQDGLCWAAGGDQGRVAMWDAE